MTAFKVSGPLAVPVYVGNNGRIVREEDGAKFFADHPSYSKKRGCYVFAMRSGGGVMPAYVGKASKGFGQECFLGHKLSKCNQALVEYEKGALVLFLFEAPVGVKTPSTQIDQLETFLIQTALSVNSDLLNVKKTKQEQWSITGVFRSGVGKPSGSALAARSMLRIKPRR
jgi:hypothetical protein